MPDIAMQLHIDAADTVYRAVATADGSRGWFTTTAEAAEGAGSVHELSFPGVPEPWRLTVTEAEPGKRLVLAAQNGPWTGTTQIYEIQTEADGGVTLRFTHAGFAAVDDGYRNFNYGWATKFVQLKAYAETGKPQAFFDGAK